MCGEPDEPPTRSSLTSSSSGENISSKKYDILDVQETSNSKSDDDLEDVHLDTLSKEDTTKVKPSFEDNDAEEEDLRC